MLKSVVVGIVVAGCSLGAASVQEGEGAKIEVFELDPVHSSTLFRIHHAGAGRFWGRFNKVSGTVAWPRDDSAAPVFDVSVKTESVDTGNDRLDGHLKGPDFFNAREFPAVTFKSTSAERLRDGFWKVTGDMTMLGVTKPVTAEVEVTGVRGNPVLAKAGWEAVFQINRSDFGMDWGIDNAALSNDVKLIVALEGGIEPGQ
ncbi:MAG: YceI family protein [Phycisphaerae bacterium]|jgi:polyisoprenoid-binding protein YceI|nr:YceI family protein [Phycisphaerae bacterium]MBT5381541.1 YceI family protein [Phycisphaerae bacterium]MBT5584513.1 YceI family protein [Phycisphaerae bacterium]